MKTLNKAAMVLLLLPLLAACDKRDSMPDVSPDKYDNVVILYTAGYNNLSSDIRRNIQTVAGSPLPMKSSSKALILITHNAVKDTDFTTPVEPVIEEPKNDNLIEYTPKECYSIEEIQAFITLKMSIDDKRICMFDMKFEFASSVLKKESEKQLDKFVEMYRKSPTMKLLINGHTDNVGSDEYNQKLSEDRAKSVYDYFLKHGIPADKMSVKGFGSKYPIDTNETEEGRAKNRRVEVDIVNLSE